MIRVKLDLKPLAQAMIFMSEQQRNFAMKDALNRAVDGMFTVAKRGIAKQANIAQGDIASGMRKVGAGSGGLSAQIINTNRWFPGGYAKFRARQSGTGATFTPWVGHTEIVQGGFLAKVKSGHESIFKRMGKKRMPIEDVGWGPNPAREMVREDHGHTLPTEIMNKGQEVFANRFAYQYARVVEQAKAKFGL